MITMLNGIARLLEIEAHIMIARSKLARKDNKKSLESLLKARTMINELFNEAVSGDEAEYFLAK